MRYPVNLIPGLPVTPDVGIGITLTPVAPPAPSPAPAAASEPAAVTVGWWNFTTGGAVDNAIDISMGMLGGGVSACGAGHVQGRDDSIYAPFETLSVCPIVEFDSTRICGGAMRLFASCAPMAAGVVYTCTLAGTLTGPLGPVSVADNFTAEPAPHGFWVLSPSSFSGFFYSVTDAGISGTIEAEIFADGDSIGVLTVTVSGQSVFA